MPGSNSESQNASAGYSSLFGIIYIFNLIVGTGALALPKAFADAGYILGGIAIVLLAIVSLLTATFVLESMSIANALRRLDTLIGEGVVSTGPMDLRPQVAQSRRLTYQSDEIYDEASESTPLITHKIEQELPPSSLFDVTICVELGEMAAMFFNKIGIILFYLAMCIYLYGDLAIYAVAIPKSLETVVCAVNDPNVTTNNTNIVLDSMPCWPYSTVVGNISRMNAYRIFLAAFIALVGPFLFFDMKKTVVLQVVTTVFRWTAFTLMLVYSILRLSNLEVQHGAPPAANFRSLPNFFGVCVYAFMCHHSIPSLVTPIRNKRNLFALLLATYTAILLFYLSLAYTGITAFPVVQDIYTLNFYGQENPGDPAAVGYFLALFPVFTLSASFPIIGVTLRNNLTVLFTHLLEPRWTISPLTTRILFPLMALLPPAAIAMATTDVTDLVGYTGTYGGLFVQYVIPASLVWAARRQRDRRLPSLNVLEASQNWMLSTTDIEDSRDEVDEAHTVDAANTGAHMRQVHRSPCSNLLWVILVFIWALIMFVFVTVNHFLGDSDSDNTNPVVISNATATATDTQTAYFL